MKGGGGSSRAGSFQTKLFFLVHSSSSNSSVLCSTSRKRVEGGWREKPEVEKLKSIIVTLFQPCVCVCVCVLRSRPGENEKVGGGEDGGKKSSLGRFGKNGCGERLEGGGETGRK